MATTNLASVALAALLLLTASLADADQKASCQVVGISDGDTLTALCAGSLTIKVRLAEIDAPEKAQPFGQKSKQSLSSLCFGKVTEIEHVTKDRYGRTVARVRCEGIDANAEQVRRGMAWVYDRYAKDSALYQLQGEARASRRGLWSEAHPVRPWEWRKIRKSK